MTRIELGNVEEGFHTMRDSAGEGISHRGLLGIVFADYAFFRKKNGKAISEAI